MLETERLFLIPANLALLESIVAEDHARISLLLGGVGIAEEWMHFPDAMVWMRDYLRENELDTRWWSYVIVHRDDACLIGNCGFKGPPDHHSTVEIGYEVATAYQGKGLAKEAAARLCEYAFAHESVKRVSALTLAKENASTGLLRSLGFHFIGEQIDIEDGVVWAWEKLNVQM
jgi:[ribosomal protein S5]-alanine N-acetyltransferase